jgi:hypothetical protein
VCGLSSELGEAHDAPPPSLLLLLLLLLLVAAQPADVVSKEAMKTCIPVTS